MPIADIYKKWQPTAGAQGSPTFKRERIQDMQLRSVNENSGEIYQTGIVDIWQSGVKQLYEVTIRTGRSIRASADHLFFTPDGWKKLKDLKVGECVNTISDKNSSAEAPSLNLIDSETEQWKPIVSWEEYYEISDQGRVRRIVGGRGSRSRGRCKQITIVDGERAVTSLNRPGFQDVIFVHREMLRAFIGEPESEKMEACHNNGNSLFNRIENLRWGTRKENTEDMVKHGRASVLCCQPEPIASIIPLGEEMTYDIEVSGPWHNFSANDFIVHNSVNEYSMRYKEPKDEFFIPAPEEIRKQSKNNKQGSDGQVDLDIGTQFSEHTAERARIELASYQEFVKGGVGKEMARINLPLTTYTYWYWRNDMNNLLKFMGLRRDKHAQKEIRDYAEAMWGLVRPLAPWACEAFEDFTFEAVRLTKLEVEAMRRNVSRQKLALPELLALGERATDREREEWTEKQKKIFGE